MKKFTLITKNNIVIYIFKGLYCCEINPLMHDFFKTNLTKNNAMY